MVRKEVILGISIFLLLLFPSFQGMAESALYRVTGENVNLRVGPGTNYDILGHRNKGDIVTVIQLYNKDWAKVRYGSTAFAYISRDYIVYHGPLPKDVTQAETPRKQQHTRSSGSTSALDAIFKIARIIAVAFFILSILCAYVETEAAVSLTIPFAFYIIGYIIGFFLSNAHLGAVIGEAMGFAILLISLAGDWFTYHPYWTIDLSDLFFKAWLVASWPFWMLDRFQLFLTKPWRNKMKAHWAPEWRKADLRKRYHLLQIPFYFLLFPLRLLNAIYYNLIIHLIYELSNYVLEVFAPSDSKLGSDNVFLWILCFPVRVVFYIGYHFVFTVVESVVWTVIDTFLPAVTLYHGTASRFATEMVCEPLRTRESREDKSWKSGTWHVGGGNYAGDGIYFGISRRTLRNYQKGACIVTRVSMGRVVDISLMPSSVYSAAGNPNAHEVSKWGLTHGYTTGEWWRAGADWWEFCLFDRQNRYNDSWRIRPVYVLNYKDGIMQRIPRGTAHWLFRKMVLKDIGQSIQAMFK